MERSTSEPRLAAPRSPCQTGALDVSHLPNPRGVLSRSHDSIQLIGCIKIELMAGKLVLSTTFMYADTGHEGADKAEKG